MATYYVSNAGSDGAAGTSEATPWATAAKVKATTFAPGDNILFNRGDTFRDTAINSTALIIAAASGSSGNPIVYGAYGDTALGWPRLSGGVIVTGWTVHSGSVYKSTIATSVVNLTVNGVIVVKATSLAAITANQWWWESNTLYVHLGGANPSSSTMEAAIRQVLSANNKDWLVLRHIWVTHGRDWSVYFENGSTDWIVEHCKVQFCGDSSPSGTLGAAAVRGATSSDRGKLLHSYLSDNNCEATYQRDCANIEIGYCWMASSRSPTADLIQFSDSQLEPGNSGIPNNLSSGWNIHDNYLDQFGLGGNKGCFIAETSGPNGGTARRNIVRGGNFGISANQTNALVEDNLILDVAGATWAGGLYIDDTPVNHTGMVFRRNVVVGCSNGLYIKEPGQTPLATSRQLFVYHNLFLDYTQRGLHCEIPIYGAIQNNVFWSTVAASNHWWVEDAIPVGQTLATDYNDIGPDKTGAYNWLGVSYASRAAFAAATTRQVNGIVSDPFLVDKALRDYRPLNISPLLDKGVVIAGTNDGYDGGAPDIGAMEYRERTISAPSVASFTPGTTKPTQIADTDWDRATVVVSNTGSVPIAVGDGWVSGLDGFIIPPGGQESFASRRAIYAVAVGSGVTAGVHVSSQSYAEGTS